MKTYILTLLSLILIISCTYTEKIRTGEQAIDRKQYAVAIPLLKKEVKKSKSRVEKGQLNYMLGQAYQKTNNIVEAIPYYKTAYDFQYGYEALEAYAQALMADEQYDEAIEAFDMLGLEIGSTYEYRDEIQACKRAKTYKEDAPYADYIVELSNFNTKQLDYAPSLYLNQLVFSSDRNASSGDEKYNWTNQKFSDIYILENDKVKELDQNINTKYHEGTTSFSKDGKTLFFSRCGDDGNKADDFCTLMVAYKENDGTWSIPQTLDFQLEGFNYIQPALSDDGKRLYFASDYELTLGGYDIFYVDKTNTGWSEPKSVGQNINSIGNELFPTIIADTLYFASNHWSGLGGLDIFKSYKRKNKWTSPFNLKHPINSGGDDFGFVIFPESALEDNELAKGYFTSNRKNGVGQDDIYSFTKVIPKERPKPPVVEKDTNELVIEKTKWELEIIVLENIHEDENNPNSRILGRRGISNANISQFLKNENAQFKTDENGSLVIELEKNQNYNFTASHTGYLTNDASYSTFDLLEEPNKSTVRYTLEIQLSKIFENQEIVLEDIYYDYDASNIREDAKPSLLNLATILNKNPSISIELASHTDCRGSADYNQNLSQKRAQSAVDFLIQQGIDSNRLNAVGYGEDAPKTSCNCRSCSESEHQLNRRTAFKITAQQ